jgi:hypothetical protein
MLTDGVQRVNETNTKSTRSIARNPMAVRTNYGPVRPATASQGRR